MSDSPRASPRIQQVMRGHPSHYATQSLLIINIIWFLYMTVAGVSLSSPDPVLLVRFGALYGPLVYQGEIWRLLSCQFVHIGLIHIGFNMYVLWAIGRDLEVIYGRVGYLTVYFFAGTCGALASLWAHPVSLSAGASGAIFGLAGAALSFYFRLQHAALKQMFLRWRNSLLAFVVYNAIFGFIIPGIDNFAHFGGLIAGFVMGYIVSSPDGTDAEAWGRTALGAGLGLAFLYGVAKYLALPLPF